MTSLSTPCAAVRAHGRGSVLTCATCLKANVPPRSPPIPITTPGAVGDPDRPAAPAEDPLQFVGRCDLQLVVAAVLGALIGTPAYELRSVAEASSLHVIIRDLADALNPQWFPTQVLAAIPAARRAGQALPFRVSLFLGLRPPAPRMSFKRTLAQRRQLGDALSALCVRERTRRPDAGHRHRL